jgi:hypothetical protein
MPLFGSVSMAKHWFQTGNGLRRNPALPRAVLR